MKSSISKIQSGVLTLCLLSTISLSAEELAVKKQNDILELVNKAIKYYPSISAAKSRYEMKKYDVDIAKSKYYPKISFRSEIGEEYTNSPSTRSSGHSSVTKTRRENTLSLVQNIYDFGATRSNVTRAIASKKESAISFENTQEELMYMVISKYINVQRFRNLLKNSKNNLEEHLRIANLVRQRVKLKVDSKASLNLVEGRLVLAQLGVKRYEQRVNSAEQELSKLTGESPKKLSKIPASLIQIKDNYSLENHPILELYTAKKEVAKASMNLKESEYYPKIALEIEGGYDVDTSATSGRTNDRKIMLTFTYDLYDGGVRNAALHQEKQELKASQKDYEEQSANVATSLSIAYNTLAVVQSELNFFKSNRDDIEKAKNAYNSQYKAGQRTLFDLLNIQSEYFNASESYLQATYDETQKKVDIQFEAGVLKNTITTASLKK